jgi:hypothetical protein
LAQYYLGVIYADGLGGDKSPEDGLAWLICVQTGVGLPPALQQAAKQRRRRLMSRITPYAMEQAEKRAATLCGRNTAAPRSRALASGTAAPRSQNFTTGTGAPRSQADPTGTAAPRPRSYAAEIAEARPQAYATEVTEHMPQAFSTSEDTMEDLLKYVSPARGFFGTLFFFPGDTMVYGATAVFDAIGIILLRDIFVGMIKLMGDLIFGLLSLIGWVLIGKFVYFFVHPLANAISASKPSSLSGPMGDPRQSQESNSS